MPWSSGTLMTEIQLAAVNPTMMTMAMKRAMPKLLELVTAANDEPMPPALAYKLTFIQAGAMAIFEKFLTDHQEALRDVVTSTANVEVGQALRALEEAPLVATPAARQQFAEAYGNYTADLCIGFATFILGNKELLSVFELLSEL